MRTISNETADWARDIAKQYLAETDGYRDDRTLNNCRKARLLLRRLEAAKQKNRR